MNRIAIVCVVVAAWAAGSLAAAPARAAQWHVAPGHAAASDSSTGTPERPLKTFAKALDLAKGGDTIVLAAGEYPAAAIGKTYDKPLTIRAAKDARAAFVGGLSINRGGGLRLSGLVFTWTEATRPANPMGTFVAITGAQDVEIAECEFVDDPKRTEWAGWLCNITDSRGITVRDTKAHHFYFGFSAHRSRDVTFRNLEIGPWTHEDAIRVTDSEGPVLIEGSHICNMAVAGRKGGHVDAIQVVGWAENLTVRNCHIHGMGQGIGAFGGRDRRHKNWRIEGNLIYDVYAPHVCSVYNGDGIVVVNNTFPQNRPILSNCTGGIVRNNIIGVSGAKEPGVESDYNLYIPQGPKLGEHDLVGVDPKFVNAPLATIKSDSRRLKEMTRSKFFLRGALRSLFAVGDLVEVVNSDGSARDGKQHKVTAVGDDFVEVDPPLAGDPAWAGIVLHKWPAGHKNLVPDYRLRPDSPAIDSADSTVKRDKDRDGHEPTDAPGTANTGAGPVKYLDRGAFEFTRGK